MNKKFELIKDDTIVVRKHKLYRIRALIDFDNVTAGDLGGYVANENNLSQMGNCWIFDDAKVFGKAHVYGNAHIYDNAQVLGHATIYDNAKIRNNAQVFGGAHVCGNATVCDEATVFDDVIRVCDDAKVCGSASIFHGATICGNAIIKKDSDYIVFENTWSSGRCFTYTKSNKMWKVGCFYGTGEALVEKAYADNENSGKHYELYVNLVKEMEKLDN